MQSSFIWVSHEKPSSDKTVMLYFWWGCMGNLKFITLGDERVDKVDNLWRHRLQLRLINPLSFVQNSGRVNANFRVYNAKNLAVRKIMEAMRTRKAGLGLNASQTKHEANDHGTWREYVKGKSASFAKNVLFRWIVWWTNTFEIRHSFFVFVYLFSLVRISEFLYAHFSSTCVRCTHLLKS